jgi:NADH-quinone oxidoreductase subunit L
VVDQLTAIMLVVVTGVAMLVQIYSIGYMHGDPRYPRFFAYLSFFSAAMLSLVIADNLLLFFVSWELVGLASYLLIGFWFEKPSAMRAAKKAFIVTRVGDVGLFLGVLLLFSKTGHLNFREIFDSVPTLMGVNLQIGQLLVPVLPLAGLLLFAGAIGKSAQFPLHVWLPDAMEGPTPVSALIHAATMVAAGVYLVGRTYPIFNYDPHSLSITLTVVGIVGAITAFMAATIATVQNDIKRVLAYSTISQLGYMMLGLGVGGYTAGLLHLMTHAFFKANLFLGSGSVIHGTGTQDMQEMGGLAKKMPRTYWTFLIGTAALAGLPLTAGFFSKDEILLEAFHANTVLFWMGLAAAFLTAFYMTRLMALTFWGEPRNHEVHAHESPRVMTTPLVVLAVLSIVSGYVAWPTNNIFHHLVHFGEGALPFSWTVAIMATSSAALGIGLGWAVFMKRAIAPSAFRLRVPWAYNLLANKYYLDEIYWAVLVVPLFWLTRTLAIFDQKIVDGLVNGVAYLTVGLAIVQGWIDKWIVDGLVNLVGGVTKLSGRVLRYGQTGIVQNYMLVLFAGVLVVVCRYVYSDLLSPILSIFR